MKDEFFNEYSCLPPFNGPSSCFSRKLLSFQHPIPIIIHINIFFFLQSHCIPGLLGRYSRGGKCGSNSLSCVVHRITSDVSTCNVMRAARRPRAKWLWSFGSGERWGPTWEGATGYASRVGRLPRSRGTCSGGDGTPRLLLWGGALSSMMVFRGSIFFHVSRGSVWHQEQWSFHICDNKFNTVFRNSNDFLFHGCLK